MCKFVQKGTGRAFPELYNMTTDGITHVRVSNQTLKIRLHMSIMRVQVALVGHVLTEQNHAHFKWEENRQVCHWCPVFPKGNQVLSPQSSWIRSKHITTFASHISLFARAHHGWHLLTQMQTTRFFVRSEWNLHQEEFTTSYWKKQIPLSSCLQIN